MAETNSTYDPEWGQESKDSTEPSSGAPEPHARQTDTSGAVEPPDHVLRQALALSESPEAGAQSSEEVATLAALIRALKAHPGKRTHVENSTDRSTKRTCCMSAPTTFATCTSRSASSEVLRRRTSLNTQGFRPTS